MFRTIVCVLALVSSSRFSMAEGVPCRPVMKEGQRLKFEPTESLGSLGTLGEDGSLWVTQNTALIALWWSPGQEFSGGDLVGFWSYVSSSRLEFSSAKNNFALAKRGWTVEKTLHPFSYLTHDIRLVSAEGIALRFVDPFPAPEPSPSLVDPEAFARRFHEHEAEFANQSVPSQSAYLPPTRTQKTKTTQRSPDANVELRMFSFLLIALLFIASQILLSAGSGYSASSSSGSSSSSSSSSSQPYVSEGHNASIPRSCGQEITGGP